MTVRGRRAWRVVIGGTGTSAGRQTLGRAIAALLVGVVFALNFVAFEVAQGGQLRSESESGQHQH